jgi:hypothetical protein
MICLLARDEATITVMPPESLGTFDVHLAIAWGWIM